MLGEAHVTSAHEHRSPTFPRDSCGYGGETAGGDSRVHRTTFMSALFLIALVAPRAHADTPGSAHAARLGPFDLEAHRGGRALRPENTLPSFANALSMGVDTLELDIGVTSDQAIVVSHERGLNPDLARTADGVYVASPGIPFVQLRLEEVRKYDVGQIRPDSAYAAQFPDQRPVSGTRIPTLK